MVNDHALIWLFGAFYFTLVCGYLALTLGEVGREPLRAKARRRVDSRAA